MGPRTLPLVMLLVAPLAALAAFQGMITAGLVPLALFGPVYALGRLATDQPEHARVEAARVAVAATVGAGLGLAPAVLFLGRGVGLVPPTWTTAGLAVLGVGMGALAGLSTAPAARPLTDDEQRRWLFAEALTPEHARGLALLFLIVLCAGLLLGTLRDALVDLTGTGPWLALPSERASFVVVVPLTLAPLALGFLLPTRSGMALSLGGLVALALAPLAVLFDLPVETPGGAWVPLSLRPTPGLDAHLALAPAGAGALLGAGIGAVLPALRHTRFAGRTLAAGTGALVALLTHGWAPALALVCGIAIAAVCLSWRTREAPLGAALAMGAFVGLAFAPVLPNAQAAGIAALAGIVAGTAVVTAGAARSLQLPTESARSVRTLWYLLAALAIGGAFAWLASMSVANSRAPFEAPHARALAAAAGALVTGRSAPLLVLGLVGGAFVQRMTRSGALAAIGFLVGPVTALLLLAGSVLRSFWEDRLLTRAREGFVVRGQMGYELLRVHVVVVGLLAGEAIAVAAAQALR